MYCFGCMNVCVHVCVYVMNNFITRLKSQFDMVFTHYGALCTSCISSGKEYQ